MGLLLGVIGGELKLDLKKWCKSWVQTAPRPPEHQKKEGREGGKGEGGQNNTGKRRKT